jgi:uncharacterized membrane protein
MKIFPIALVIIGALGVAKYFNLIPLGMMHLIGPILLIALGVALLFRRPRYCRSNWRSRHGGGSPSAPQPPPAGIA